MISNAVTVVVISNKDNTTKNEELVESLISLILLITPKSQHQMTRANVREANVTNVNQDPLGIAMVANKQIQGILESKRSQKHQKSNDTPGLEEDSNP